MSIYKLIDSLQKKFKQFQGDKKKKLEAKAQFRSVVTHFNLLGDADKEVEFFFYAQYEENAQSLQEDLVRLNYFAEVYPSQNQWLVTGYTPKIDIGSKVFDLWVEKMYEISYLHDAVFDGYGVICDNPYDDGENPFQGEPKN